MEAEELAIVLSRASDLHLKISDAIERSMKTPRPSQGFDSPSTVLDTISSASGSPRASGLELDVANYSDGKPWQGPSREARSLVAIREALETLETQLEDLQKLQAVQMQERENALSELEESRRMLLRRLREHQGKEWEVVNEALAFAGEPVEELAEDEEEEEFSDEEEPSEPVQNGIAHEYPGSPEVGDISGDDNGAVMPVTPPTIYSPVTPPSNYSNVVAGPGERVLDPVFNLEASLDRVADGPEEEDSDSEEEGGGLWGTVVKVAGGALTVAALVAAYGVTMGKGGGKIVGGKAGGAVQQRARGYAPTATLSNRALQREKSGLGGDRDGMPLCTVRERTVSPVKKGRSADVLLARG